MSSYRTYIPVFILLPLFLQAQNALRMPGSLVVATGGEVENLGIDVNSVYAEQYPIVSADGKTLYYARRYHPQNVGEANEYDIWVSYLQGDYTWSKAVNLGPPLNNTEPNAVVGVSTSGDVLYLMGDYHGNPYQGVSVSYRQGRTWSDPKALSINNFYNEDTLATYYVNGEGTTLLMSVKRADSYGQRDLYMCQRQDSVTWSAPRNLGPRINTAGREASISVASDNKTIYFTSDGREGDKRVHLYKCKRIDDTWTRWTEPVEVMLHSGASADDNYFSVAASGSYLFYATTNSEFGMTDLCKESLPNDFQPDPVVLLSGKLLNALTREPMRGKLKYQELHILGKTMSYSTKDNGVYHLVLPYGTDVTLYGEANGFISSSTYLNLSDDNLQELDFDETNPTSASLVPIHPGNPEVEQIQLRLTELDRDLFDLEVKRQGYQFIPKLKAQTKKTATLSDSELERLKKQYQKLDHPARTDKPAEAGPTPAKDRELTSMKAKYNSKVNGNKINAPDADNDGKPASKDELTGLKQRYGKYSGKTEPAAAPVPVDTSLNVYKEMIRQELEKEWAEPMKTELQDALMDDVALDLQKDLDNDAKKLLNVSLKDKVKKQLRLRQEALDRQETEDARPQEPTALTPLEAEIRKQVRDEVKSSLKASMKDPVRQELKLEMTYYLKRDLRDQLQQELNNKLSAQAEAEKKKPFSAPISDGPKQHLALKKQTGVLREYKEMESDMLFYPIQAGQIIPMYDIFFKANKDELLPDSRPALDRLVRLMQNNLTMVVEVGVHTNGGASQQFANTLTTERARAIAGYLQGKGVASNRVQYKGYGNTLPLIANDTEAGRRKNQRVEIRILQ